MKLVDRPVDGHEVRTLLVNVDHPDMDQVVVVQFLVWDISEDGGSSGRTDRGRRGRRRITFLGFALAAVKVRDWGQGDGVLPRSLPWVHRYAAAGPAENRFWVEAGLVTNSILLAFLNQGSVEKVVVFMSCSLTVC